MLFVLSFLRLWWEWILHCCKSNSCSNLPQPAHLHSQLLFLISVMCKHSSIFTVCHEEKHNIVLLSAELNSTCMLLLHLGSFCLTMFLTPKPPSYLNRIKALFTNRSKGYKWLDQAFHSFTAAEDAEKHVRDKNRSVILTERNLGG